MATDQQSSASESTTVSQTLVLLVGSGGLPEYSKQFSLWADRWQKAADSVGIPVETIGNTAPARDLSDRDAFSDAVRKLAAVKSFEPLWLVYLGHGTFDGRKGSLNLAGEDLTEEQFAAMLKDARRPVAVVLCSSCSSPFLNALSGPNRVIISATKDGNQVQYARFGDEFSKAISTPDADIDRDGQVCLLEAWLFASRRTAEFYSSEGRLATEHSLLDDNGDQKGTRAENFEGFRLKSNISNKTEMDGKTASRWVFVRSEEEQKLSPEQRKTRDELEAQLDALRARRESMDEKSYLLELEKLVLPLSQLYDAADKSAAPK